MAENHDTNASGIAVHVESPEDWQRLVKVEVDRALFDREYAKRLRQAAKSYQQPGFRKGRTPKALVEKDLGQQLRDETVGELVKQGWTRAIMEHRLLPLTDPALSNLAFPEEGPLRFELTIEVKPEVEVRDYDGLPLRKRRLEVRDDDVDTVIERLREGRAEYRPVERPAAAGDRLTVDLVPSAWDGQPDGAKTIAGQQFILGEETNMPAFNEGLEGAAEGDERTVEVTYPEEHGNEQLRGQTISFHCTVQEVAERILPEVDDAFAASIEPDKTLLELRADIRRDLGKDLERQLGDELDQQIQRELVKRHDVTLPPSMVESYLDSGIEELHRRNAQYGRPSSPEQDAEYREQGRPHAERALKGMLLMEAIRRREEIKVEPAEVDDRIEQIAREHGFEVEKYREFVNSGDERGRLEYEMLERRTYDFLLSRAEIAEVPPDTDVLNDQGE